MLTESLLVPGYCGTLQPLQLAIPSATLVIASMGKCHNHGREENPGCWSRVITSHDELKLADPESPGR